MISGFNIKKKLVSISLKAKLMALQKLIILYCEIIFSIFKNYFNFFIKRSFLLLSTTNNEIFTNFSKHLKIKSDELYKTIIIFNSLLIILKLCQRFTLF